MSTPFLACRNRSGTPAVFRYVGATATQVGNTFGTAETGVASSTCCADRVIQFRGPNDLYAFVRGSVYKFNTGTSNWDLVHSIPAAATNIGHVGPYIVNVNGVPKLVVISFTAGTTWRAASSVDGTTWVNGAATVTPTGDSKVYTSLVYRNRIHWLGDTDEVIMIYNPASDTFSSVSTTSALGISFSNQHLLIFNDRLFVSGMSLVGGSTVLAEIVGGVTVFVVTIFVPVGSSFQNADTKSCLFTDGTNMYWMGYDSSTASEVNGGVQCFEISPTFVVTNITTIVIPTSIRSGQGTGTVARRSTRIRAVIDAEANPGGVPDIYIFHSPTSGVPGPSWNMYKWNGSATLIGAAGLPDDTGGDVADALPSDPTGSGKRFWTLDELDIQIDSVVLAIGGETVTFTVWAATPQTVIVDFFYDDDAEVAISQATIDNPSSGVLVGNEIQSLSATAAGNTYTCRWRTPLDGFVAGDRAQLMGRVRL